MAHNTRIRLDDKWVIGKGVSEFVTIDTNITKAWNGDEGGSWSPTANIVIGGAGMVFAGLSHSLGGTGSQVTTNIATHAAIVHGDNDHIKLGATHAGRSRSISARFDTAIFVTGWDDQLGPYSSPISTALGANAITHLRVHNRATFTTVTFRFIVGSSHGPPATLPAFRVFAVDVNGVRLPLITNGSSGYVPFSPTPASAAAWYAAGAVQSLVYTLDGGVVIDTSKYSYWAEIVEEQGAGAAVGNVYLDATCTFTNITDMRPQ
jgi:hypothetical protein